MRPGVLCILPVMFIPGGGISTLDNTMFKYFVRANIILVRGTEIMPTANAGVRNCIRT
jgi:hypothetical protein